ncbi:MAG: XdhC family protein [Desulfobacterales bacterium]|jgi:xanthine dehydrogenase accessory factor
MKTITETICNLLNAGQKMVVAKIVSQQGSTPRSAGSQMVITGNGYHSGTIGGGLLEAQIIEKGKAILNSGSRERFVSVDLNHQEIAAMGMICGGAVEVFLDHIAPTPKNISLFSNWRWVMDNRENGYLITMIDTSGDGAADTERCIIRADGSIEGTLLLTSEGREAVRREAFSTSFIKTIQVENCTAIAEPSLKPKTAFLFGAGHVAQPTATIAAMAGFSVVVLDDRDAFANTERFPDAKAVVIPEFSRALDNLPIDDDAFVVIFTRGHLHDKEVLAQALKTSAGYIGMIGSRRKRNTIFQALIEEGFTDSDLKRVHSPIGLKIAAETPEEIAVSIVAEMIQKRSQKGR